MKDFKAVVGAYERIDFTQRKAALATVVRVHGSSYRSPGARMLITDDGRWTGSISGGCLEGDALRKARRVMNEGKAITVTYDTREESNQSLGVSLGCNGVIDVLIEPVDPFNKNNPIKFFADFISARRPMVIATVFSSSLIGKKYLYNPLDEIKKNTGAFTDRISPDLKRVFLTKKSVLKKYSFNEEEVDVFLEFVQPAISLLILGGGFDARPVCQLAKTMGWEVRITDECVAHVAPVFFPDADNLSLCQREFIDRDFDITPYTACILMSHNYEYDRDVLRKLITTEAPYIGILGPRQRFIKMQKEFSSEGMILTEEDLGRIHSPIGLDIGAETPDEISVSIIAEIQARFSLRHGGFLKSLKGPIHRRNKAGDRIMQNTR